MYPRTGVRVYKLLTNKTAPRGRDYDVVFGTAAAYGGSMAIRHAWTINGGERGINTRGPVGVIPPSNLLHDINTVEVMLTPSTDQELVAYLHLLGKRQCTCTYACTCTCM